MRILEVLTSLIPDVANDKVNATLEFNYLTMDDEGLYYCDVTYSSTENVQSSAVALSVYCELSSVLEFWVNLAFFAFCYRGIFTNIPLLLLTTPADAVTSEAYGFTDSSSSMTCTIYAGREPDYVDWYTESGATDQSHEETFTAVDGVVGFIFQHITPV